MTKASDNIYPKVLLAEGSAPSSPAAGNRALYVLSSDHLAYLKDSAGAVVNLISNPMTASGDIIYGGSSGVPTRLAKGSDGQVLTLASGVPSWAAGGGAGDLVSASYKRTAGNYTTTSSSFGDVDNTNMNFTKTTGARRCLVGFMGSCESSVSADIVAFDLVIDGASVGGTDGVIVARLTTASHRYNVSHTFMTDVLTAASHTFKIQWKRLSGTGTITLHGNSSSQVSQFWMTELYAA